MNCNKTNKTTKLNTIASIKPKTAPIILDGIPRTLNQAILLDKLLNSIHKNNILVVYLSISEEEATNRILNRIVCPECKRSYNLINENLKPKIENICDNCGVELAKRNDDEIDTFKVRYNI